MDWISVPGRSKIVMIVAGLIVALAALLAIGIFTFGKVSPWPMALMLRFQWDRSGLETNRAMERFVPAGVAGKFNLQYDPSDPNAKLDVFYPSAVEPTKQVLPVVVWVHGGSWISGSKDYVTNYLKILASKGFTVVGVDYALAPAKRYPTPVRELNQALDFLNRDGETLHADMTRLFLAGSSAGAQIAAQLANVISSSAYAGELDIQPSIERSQLKGVVFHCGAFDAISSSYRRGGVLWAYFGTKDFARDPRFLQFSVARHVTPNFPATFLSAGNEDSLTPQSYTFAENLAEQGVYVDRLFFPQDYTPKVWHEFQFDLDTAAGQLALERSVNFMVQRLLEPASMH
jgi:acetyl esterase